MIYCAESKSKPTKMGCGDLNWINCLKLDRQQELSAV
jgi:hypothetical protein